MKDESSSRQHNGEGLWGFQLDLSVIDPRSEIILHPSSLIIL
jgi:hypothetical protein